MKIIFFLLLVGWCFFTNAQLTIKLYEDKAYLNTLEKQYSKTNNDSIKAYTALKLSYAYKRAKNLPKAQQFFKNGVLLSKNNSFLKAVSYYYQAYILLGDPNIKIIEENFKKSDSLLSRFPYPEAYKIRSDAWLGLGVLEQMKGSEQKGLDAYINHALPLAKKSGNNFIMAKVNKFIGISLMNAEERLKANKYLQEGLLLFERSSPESEAMKKEAIVELSIILIENHVYLNNLGAAKKYLDKAFGILKNYPNSNAFLFYYYAEGIYYDKKGQYIEASSSFNKGIALATGGIENYYVNRMKYSKFELLRKQNKNQEAILLMQELLKSPILFPGDRNTYYNRLAKTYAKTGNMKEAYNWSQKYIEINDSLQATNYKSSIMEMEKKYQTSEKERKIKELEAKNKIIELTAKNNTLSKWIFIGVSLLLLSLVLFLWILIRNNKKLSLQQNENYQHRINELKQKEQMTAVRALLEGEEKERNRIARDLHDGLGGMLAGTKMQFSKLVSTQDFTKQSLENISENIDNSLTELRSIARNMMPKFIINNQDLDTALIDLCNTYKPHFNILYQSYEINKNISEKDILNIYRIIQEILTNAAKHSDAKNVLLQCSQNKNILYITIEDNGKGLPTSSNNTENFGLNNIQNRVKSMNGKIEITSKENIGTTFNIEVYVTE